MQFSGVPQTEGTEEISLFCCKPSPALGGGDRRDKSFWKSDKEASIDAPAKAEGSPDLVSIWIPFSGVPRASKIFTEGIPVALEISLLTCWKI